LARGSAIDLDDIGTTSANMSTPGSAINLSDIDIIASPSHSTQGAC